MTTEHPLRTRWLIRRDMDECLEIPGITPWDAEDMVVACRHKSSISLVCELDEVDIQAWMIYTIHRSCFEIANLAAYDWEFGACFELVQKLVDKLGYERDIILVTVPEEQDDILLFFRMCGFTAVIQQGGEITMRYNLPTLLTMTRMNGVPISRATGFPCLVPEGECNE